MQFNCRPIVHPSLVQTSKPPPPASLIISDSIVRNIQSKMAATYCFPGAKVLGMVQQIPSLLSKHSHVRNVVIYVGTNDNAYQQS